jgi:N6-adenosine-specific RNA methylase IME4
VSLEVGQLVEISISELREHAYASSVPLLSGGELDALRADIAERELQVPVDITTKAVLLDGRARVAAVRALGFNAILARVVAPRDEEEHILLCALRRRQLTVSQTAAFALDLEANRERRAANKQRSLANLKHSPVEVATLPPPTGIRERDRIAGEYNIGARIVQYAASVQAADPELFERIKRNEIPAQKAFLELQRRERYAAIGEPDPLPDGPFELIYADPPWQLGNPSAAHAPEQHYPTMPTSEIAALQVPSADDSVLYLWAVSSLLQDALDVITAWGFTHKTTLVWVKNSIGPGVWARNRHELILVARKGSYPPPERTLLPDSVLEAPRREHSQKPEGAYELIERAYPHASKVELFARNARPGWTAWGNQAPKANTE